MTFKEFGDLPEEEQQSAFSELSSKDKMLVRQQQTSVGTMHYIPCNGCEFRIGINAACAAHPGGLTADIIKAAIKHCEYRETHN